MKIPFVDLRRQHALLKQEIDEVINDVIDKSAFVRGPYVEQFEQDFKRLSDTKYCISCANGTDALFLCMKALGIEEGDEVITTAHSWISTSETITQAGGRVVFCDTDRETFTIDPNKIEDKITEQTKGIIPVHLYGQPADMVAICEIAKKHNLWVIEDCAQAHIAELQGRRVGTFGDAATYSFYPGKNLGAMGDAGCVVTNNDEVAEFCTLYARHGGKGDHQIEGINSRMDGIQAAVLTVKMKHLEVWTDLRRCAAVKYNQMLQHLPQVARPIVRPERKHVYHLYVIRTIRRDELREYLRQNGISTVLNYPKALPFYKAYEYLKHKPSDFPNAYANQNEILSLPLFPEITDRELEYISSHIEQFFSSRM